MDRDKVLAAAQKLVEKKRYDKAIIEYQKLVAADPADVRTLLKIGDLHSRLSQFAEAITVYERVGQYYSSKGFAVKAIAVYKQVREIIRKHVPHLEDRFGHIVPRLAEIYTQLGLTSDALATYDEVATRLQRAGRDRDAIDIFRKVVDLDPQNPLPHLRLAEAYVRVRDVDNAIERFGAAAEILLRLDRKDDALRVVERLLMHRAVAKFARLAAEIYISRGAPNDGMAALTKLQVCFKENPRDLETLDLLARTFDHLGQPAKSIEVQKEAARIAREGNHHEAFTRLLETLTRRAPNDDGVRQLQALARQPSVAPEPESISVVEEVDVDDIEVVEVDEDIEALEAEEEEPFALRPSQPQIDPNDPQAMVRETLGQVERYRRARQYHEAIGLLQRVLPTMMGARELNERLCDLLIESGDQDGAVAQMIHYAAYLAGDGADVDAAARLLDEVLLLEPEHPHALRMLQQLGYHVDATPYAEPGHPEPSTDQIERPQPAAAYQPQTYGQPPPAPAGYAAAAPPPPSKPAYDPSEPLPSYDLEEVGPAEALSTHPQGEAQPLVSLDDPFGAAPLPSFPIEEDSQGYAAPARESALPPVSQPPTSIASAAQQAAERVAAGQTPGSASYEAPPPVSARSEATLDEDALEEVEFFTSHQMFDEAKAIVVEQLARLPNHPLLLEKQREITEMESAAASAPPPAPPMAASLQQAGLLGQTNLEDTNREEVDDDRSFDIAASLDALDALDAGSAPPPPPQDDPTQVSVESVFEQFKAGVKAQVAESDAATHYDLAVAYREMGLFPDAIQEFELASRDPSRECVCQSMIGELHIRQGNMEAAIDAFIRGLHASQKTTDQELRLTYEVGNSYEDRGNSEQALYYFQLVARIDPDYKDPRGGVQDRISRLTPDPPAGQPAKAVGAEDDFDEFDAAFDDLLELP